MTHQSTQRPTWSDVGETARQAWEADRERLAETAGDTARAITLAVAARAEMVVRSGVRHLFEALHGARRDR